MANEKRELIGDVEAFLAFDKKSTQINGADLLKMLEVMGNMESAERILYFNDVVAEKTASIEPIGRDVAIAKISALLKPSGIRKSSIEQAIKDLSMGSDDDSVKPESKSQSDILVELAETVTVFHDDLQKPYAVVPVKEHSEIWPIYSKGFFKNWLVNQYYCTTSKAPNGDAIKQALNVIEAKAMFDGPEYKLNLRVAEHRGDFYYDLADDLWRVIKVTSNG